MLAFATACYAYRERLGQRGVLGREAVRDLEQQGFAEQHALGVGADIVVGIADALRSLPRSDSAGSETDFGAGLNFSVVPGP